LDKVQDLFEKNQTCFRKAYINPLGWGLAFPVTLKIVVDAQVAKNVGGCCHVLIRLCKGYKHQKYDSGLPGNWKYEKKNTIRAQIVFLL
jgi:hypothetical protein